MIEAGVEEFCSYDPDLESPANIVSDIFKAMIRGRSSEVAQFIGNLRFWVDN
jgi:hypothetical protein